MGVAPQHTPRWGRGTPYTTPHYTTPQGGRPPHQPHRREGTQCTTPHSKVRRGVTTPRTQGEEGHPTSHHTTPQSWEGDDTTPRPQRKAGHQTPQSWPHGPITHHGGSNPETYIYIYIYTETHTYLYRFILMQDGGTIIGNIITE